MASLSKTPAAARPTLLVLGAASLIIGLLKTAKPEAIARNTGMAEAGMVRTLGLRETAAGAGATAEAAAETDAAGAGPARPEFQTHAPMYVNQSSTKKRAVGARWRMPSS